MGQEQPKILCETISAVRRAGRKRSVPVDLATFLVKEAKTAEARVRVRRGMAENEPLPDGALEHVHLIGDALVAAEAIAADCGKERASLDSFRRANDRVMALLSGGTYKADKKLYAELQQLVNEKKALVQSLAQMFGLEIEVSSAIDFVRKREEIADRVMQVLGAVFQDDNIHNTVDLARYEKIRDSLPIGSDHFPSPMRWLDLARSTLPKSKLLLGDEIEQARRAYYGATEGGIHAGVIEQGGEVVTYEGSEHTGDPPTKIIKNMQRLVELALYHGQEIELARKLHEQLSIEQKLNGKGILPTPLSVRPTDPFTLEYDAAGGGLLAPEKLPLLIFEGNRLRPVTAQEVLSVVVDPKSRGIAGPRSVVWKHNLCVIAKLFDANEGRFDHPAIQRVMLAHGVKKQELKDWARSIACGNSENLVPGSVEFAGVFVEAIACEVEANMKEIIGEKKSATAVVDMGAAAGTAASDAAPLDVASEQLDAPVTPNAVTPPEETGVK